MATPAPAMAPSSRWRGVVVGLLAGAMVGGGALVLGGSLFWLLALPLGAVAGAMAHCATPPLLW